MELALLVWAASVVETLKYIFGIAIAVSFGVLFWLVVVSIDGHHEKPLAKRFKQAIAGIIISTFVWMITPSEKTMWLMAAGYTTQSIYTSESGIKIRKIIDIKLDKMLDDAIDAAKQKM